MIAHLTHAGAFRLGVPPQPVMVKIASDRYGVFARTVQTMDGSNIGGNLSYEGITAGWALHPVQRPGPMRLRLARKIHRMLKTRPQNALGVHPDTARRAMARLGKADRRQR